MASTSAQRTLPLLVCLGSTASGTLALYAAGAPRDLLALIACMAAALIVATPITLALRWKISIHSLVAAGTAVTFTVVFGPVLAVIKARDYDHALELANGTEYGLTGAVYTRDEEKIERAKREFHVGNLYINRKCTGALVGIHPFGGFKMSGTDSKAGGRDYLLLFMQPKSIARKKNA